MGPLGFYKGREPRYLTTKLKEIEHTELKLKIAKPGLTIFFRPEALEEDGEAGGGDAAAAIEMRPDLTGDVEACRLICSPPTLPLPAQCSSDLFVDTGKKIKTKRSYQNRISTDFSTKIW